MGQEEAGRSVRMNQSLGNTGMVSAENKSEILRGKFASCPLVPRGACCLLSRPALCSSSLPPFLLPLNFLFSPSLDLLFSNILIFSKKITYLSFLLPLFTHLLDYNTGAYLRYFNLLVSRGHDFTPGQSR